MSKTISLRSTKEAALYFDQVLPLDGLTAAIGKRNPGQRLLYEQSLPYDEKELALDVIGSLLPNAKTKSVTVIGDLLATHLGLLKVVEKNSNPLDLVALEEAESIFDIFNRVHGTNISAAEFLKNPDSVREKVKSIASGYLREMGFGASPVWGVGADHGNPEQPVPCFETSISGLNLVDAGKLTWQEVIEFRRDPDSRKALRDLRLFFSENFENKDKAYISDKLMQLVDRQEEVARLWKFETVQKSLSVAVSGQSGLISSLAGLATAFGGAPLTIVAGAALAFPVANFGLEFGKILIDAAKEKVDRPTRFLTQLRGLSNS